MNHDNKGGWVAQNSTQMDALRDEQRWVRAVEHGERFTTLTEFTMSHLEAIDIPRRDTVKVFPICRTDRGESILMPDQVAVSREWLRRIGGILREAFQAGISTGVEMHEIKRMLTSPTANQPNNKDPECHT